jgi:hypothetical protein
VVENTTGVTLTSDLHISRSRREQVFLTSRQDGWIGMLVAVAATS